MMQSNLKENNYKEDEIDLRKLVSSLIERKFLILGLTAFITVLGYLYSTTLVTNYQATLIVASPSSNAISDLNKLNYVDKTKRRIYANFLANVSTRTVQKEIFLV